MLLHFRLFCVGQAFHGTPHEGTWTWWPAKAVKDGAAAAGEAKHNRQSCIEIARALLPHVPAEEGCLLTMLRWHWCTTADGKPAKQWMPVMDGQVHAQADHPRCQR